MILLSPIRHGLIPCALAVMAFAAAGCDEKRPYHEKNVIVIGMDGMDPRLSEKLMNAGDLPNLAKLRDKGGFKPLGTSMPPQSPVAWSNFITGADPGVHGVFDFIQRDPSVQLDRYYYGAGDTPPIENPEGWEIGAFKIPLDFWPFNHKQPETLLLRDGTPFWEYLDQVGVPMWIYDIPANYPASESKHGHMCCVPGMGMIDLRGGLGGTYQFFSERIEEFDDPGGGEHYPLIVRDDVATAKLVGPFNPFLKKPAASKIEFKIYRHPTEASARIDIQDQSVVLKEGEWSEWLQTDFKISQPSFLPDGTMDGICRFYLQEVRPNLSVYVTPINVDPAEPSVPYTEPASFSTEIAAKLGKFYTTGFQEDHKALSNNVFTDEEYKEQAWYVLDERMNLLKYAVDRYNGGFLFFYFSSTDVQGHMFWWDTDDKHPVRDPENAKKYHGVLEDVYRKMDSVVGDIVARYGDKATIMVMSDHGFCNFRREVNLNAWLKENGYLGPEDAKSIMSFSRGTVVDWDETRAYSLGLNGLYLNLKGRERDGIVEPADRDALIKEISEKLLAFRDEDGSPVVKHVYRSDEIYSGPHASKAPDMLVGFYRGYRASWGNTTGSVSSWIIRDNTSEWSADHCIAADEVPGVVFANRPILRENPSLVDMAPTILEEFGVSKPESMKGGSIFKTSVAAAGAADKGV